MEGENVWQQKAFLSRGDIREVEFRLDKEGKDFHHFEDFAKMWEQ